MNKFEKEVATLKDYVVLDFETTGLDTYFSEILRVSCIKVVNNQIIDTFDRYCDAGYKPTIRSIKINGITEEMIKGKPYPIMLLPAMFDFIGESLVVIHNAPFELEMIKSTYEKNGFPPSEIPKFDFIDTLVISKNILPKEDVISYSLENLMYIMGLDLKPHDSVEDCKITYHLIQHLKSYIGV